MKNSITVNRNMTGKSCRSISMSTPTGSTTAAMPSTPRILNMLEPITLPIARSSSWRSALVSEAASSGRLVPSAMMVRPMTISETSRLRATKTAPSTRKRELSGSTTRPTSAHSTA